MATKKVPAKSKTVTKKTIAVRSKDGKKLAGSVSLGGKKAPTAKKAVENKIVATEIADFQANIIDEATLNRIAQENEEMFEIFLSDVTPDNPDFELEFSLTNLQVSMGPNDKLNWSEDILRAGKKVGVIENRNSSKRHYSFNNPIDKKAFRQAAKDAYLNSDKDSHVNTLGYYLEYLAGYTKIGDV